MNINISPRTSRSQTRRSSRSFDPRSTVKVANISFVSETLRLSKPKGINIPLLESADGGFVLSKSIGAWVVVKDLFEMEGDKRGVKILPKSFVVPKDTPMLPMPNMSPTQRPCDFRSVRVYFGRLLKGLSQAMRDKPRLYTNINDHGKGRECMSCMMTINQILNNNMDIGVVKGILRDLVGCGIQAKLFTSSEIYSTVMGNKGEDTFKYIEQMSIQLLLHEICREKQQNIKKCFPTNITLYTRNGMVYDCWSHYGDLFHQVNLLRHVIYELFGVSINRRDINIPSMPRGPTPAYDVRIRTDSRPSDLECTNLPSFTCTLWMRIRQNQLCTPGTRVVIRLFRNVVEFDGGLQTTLYQPEYESISEPVVLQSGFKSAVIIFPLLPSTLFIQPQNSLSKYVEEGFPQGVTLNLVIEYISDSSPCYCSVIPLTVETAFTLCKKRFSPTVTQSGRCNLQPVPYFLDSQATSTFQYQVEGCESPVENAIIQSREVINASKASGSITPTSKVQLYGIMGVSGEDEYSEYADMLIPERSSNTDELESVLRVPGFSKDIANVMSGNSPREKVNMMNMYLSFPLSQLPISDETTSTLSSVRVADISRCVIHLNRIVMIQEETISHQNETLPPQTATSRSTSAARRSGKFFPLERRISRSASPNGQQQIQGQCYAVIELFGVSPTTGDIIRVRALKDRASQLGTYIRGSKATATCYRESINLPVTTAASYKGNVLWQTFEDKTLVVDCSMARGSMEQSNNRNLFVCISLYAEQTKQLQGISLIQLTLDSENERIFGAFENTKVPKEPRWLETKMLPVIDAVSFRQENGMLADAPPFELQKKIIESASKPKGSGQSQKQTTGATSSSTGSSRTGTTYTPTDMSVCVSVGYVFVPDTNARAVLSLIDSLARCVPIHQSLHVTYMKHTDTISDGILNCIARLGLISDDMGELIEAAVSVRRAICKATEGITTQTMTETNLTSDSNPSNSSPSSGHSSAPTSQRQERKTEIEESQPSPIITGKELNDIGNLMLYHAHRIVKGAFISRTIGKQHGKKDPTRLTLLSQPDDSGVLPYIGVLISLATGLKDIDKHGEENLISKLAFDCSQLSQEEGTSYIIGFLDGIVRSLSTFYLRFDKANVPPLEIASVLNANKRLLRSRTEGNFDPKDVAVVMRVSQMVTKIAVQQMQVTKGDWLVVSNELCEYIGILAVYISKIFEKCYSKWAAAVAATTGVPSTRPTSTMLSSSPKSLGYGTTASSIASALASIASAPMSSRAGEGSIASGFVSSNVSNCASPRTVVTIPTSLGSPICFIDTNNTNETRTTSPTKSPASFTGQGFGSGTPTPGQTRHGGAKSPVIQTPNDRDGAMPSESEVYQSLQYTGVLNMWLEFICRSIDEIQETKRGLKLKIFQGIIKYRTEIFAVLSTAQTILEEREFTSFDPVQVECILHLKAHLYTIVDMCLDNQHSEFLTTGIPRFPLNEIAVYLPILFLPVDQNRLPKTMILVGTGILRLLKKFITISQSEEMMISSLTTIAAICLGKVNEFLHISETLKDRRQKILGVALQFSVVVLYCIRTFSYFTPTCSILRALLFVCLKAEEMKVGPVVVELRGCIIHWIIREFRGVNDVSVFKKSALTLLNSKNASILLGMLRGVQEHLSISLIPVHNVIKQLCVTCGTVCNISVLPTTHLGETRSPVEEDKAILILREVVAALRSNTLELSRYVTQLLDILVDSGRDQEVSFILLLLRKLSIQNFAKEYPRESERVLKIIRRIYKGSDSAMSDTISRRKNADLPQIWDVLNTNLKKQIVMDSSILKYCADISNKHRLYEVAHDLYAKAYKHKIVEWDRNVFDGVSVDDSNQTVLVSGTANSLSMQMILNEHAMFTKERYYERKYIVSAISTFEPKENQDAQGCGTISLLFVKSSSLEIAGFKEYIIGEYWGASKPNEIIRDDCCFANKPGMDGELNNYDNRLIGVKLDEIKKRIGKEGHTLRVGVLSAKCSFIKRVFHYTRSERYFDRIKSHRIQCTPASFGLVSPKQVDSVVNAWNNKTRSSLDDVFLSHPLDSLDDELFPDDDTFPTLSSLFEYAQTGRCTSKYDYKQLLISTIGRQLWMEWNYRSWIRAPVEEKKNSEAIPKRHFDGLKNSYCRVYESSSLYSSDPNGENNAKFLHAIKTFAVTRDVFGSVSPVVEVISVDLTPALLAASIVSSGAVRAIEASYEISSNTEYLASVLQGVIDAGVNGGISVYLEAFFGEKYRDDLLPLANTIQSFMYSLKSALSVYETSAGCNQGFLANLKSKYDVLCNKISTAVGAYYKWVEKGGD